MRLIILVPVILVQIQGWAVEVPAKVVRVIDGDSIRAEVHGHETSIRLRWVDTPGRYDDDHDQKVPGGAAATNALRNLLPVGREVRLWGPNGSLEVDDDGQTLAVVLLEGEDSAQEHQIRAGWSPLWERYDQPPEPWRSRFQKAEDDARSASAGAWRTAPNFMEKKAKETNRKDRLAK